MLGKKYSFNYVRCTAFMQRQVLVFCLHQMESNNLVIKHAH